jgi:hypothetical protein
MSQPLSPTVVGPTPYAYWALKVQWPTVIQGQRGVIPVDRHFAVPGLIALRPCPGAKGLVVVEQTQVAIDANVTSDDGVAMRDVIVHHWTDEGHVMVSARIPVAAMLCFADPSFLDSRILGAPPPDGVGELGSHAYYRFRGEEPTKSILEEADKVPPPEEPVKAAPVISDFICPTCGADEVTCSFDCSDSPCCCELARREAKTRVMVENPSAPSLVESAKALFAPKSEPEAPKAVVPPAPPTPAPVETRTQLERRLEDAKLKATKRSAQTGFDF